MGTLTTNLTLETVTGSLYPNEIITGSSSGVTGCIIDYDLAGPNILRVNNIFQNSASGYASGFILNETITASGAIAEIASIVNPDIQPNTGLILTTEHISPVTRAPAQIEDIKITIPF